MELRATFTVMVLLTLSLSLFLPQQSWSQMSQEDSSLSDGMPG